MTKANRMRPASIRTVLTLGVLFLTLHGGAAGAYTIAYGDRPAFTVDFIGITESSVTEPVGTGLYGAPSVAGTQSLFFPVNFASTASGGDADETTGTLDMTIRAHPGFAITGVSIYEIGNVSVSGTPDDDPATETLADIGGSLTVAGVSVPLSVTPAAPYTPGGAGFFAFTATAALFLGDGGLQEASFSLLNSLTTRSEPGTTALIQTLYIAENAQIEIQTAPISEVPLPGALWLLASGALIFAGLRRHGKRPC